MLILIHIKYFYREIPHHDKAAYSNYTLVSGVRH